MNYRHAYHAGNFADVLKHAVLALVIEHMKLKQAAFRIIDSHAGIGLYDLGADEARRTGEWLQGIARLSGPTAAPLPDQIADLLSPYLRAVASENPSGGLERYPGSPLIAAHLTRPQDRIMLSELHPRDFELLQLAIGAARRIKAHHMDGWTALKAFLPPPERRGVILIDPPYEQRDELQRMARGLAEATRRFATGTFLLWYPIKDRAAVADFHRSIAKARFAKVLHADLLIRDPGVPDRLNGCGLVIVNPPWTLNDKLAVLMPFLAERLALEPGGAFDLGWLAAPPD